MEQHITIACLQSLQSREDAISTVELAAGRLAVGMGADSERGQVGGVGSVQPQKEVARRVN